MRWNPRTPALALAAALFALAPLAAQPPATPEATPQPQAGFEGKVNVNEVLLDVLVTDAKGDVIVGLDKGDFRVEENGRPVELTGVTFYSNRRLVESSQAAAQKKLRVDDVPEDRYFILFFDDQKNTADDAPELLSKQLDAAKRAKGWIDGELLANDWVAVVSYDNRLKVQQDFTHDKGALIEAVDDAMRGREREGNYPSRLSKDGAPSLFAALPKGDELRSKTPNIYEAMQEVARAAGNVRGRKNLLVFTYGFPGRVNNFGAFVPDQLYFEPTVQALNSSNVATYTIDLTPPGVQHPLSDAMNRMAFDTGGHYYFNIANYSTTFDQIAHENNGYYLLSYSSDAAARKPGFQEVKVTATNPEFRVKTRKGYATTPGAAGSGE